MKLTKHVTFTYQLKWISSSKKKEVSLLYTFQLKEGSNVADAKASSIEPPVCKLASEQTTQSI